MMAKKSRKQKQTLSDAITTVTPSSSPKPHLGSEASPAVTTSYEYIKNKYNHLKSVSNDPSTTIAFFEMFLDLQSNLKEMNAKLSALQSETMNANAKIDALEFQVRDLQNAVDNNRMQDKATAIESDPANLKQACGPDILEEMQSKDADMKRRVAAIEYKLSNIKTLPSTKTSSEPPRRACSMCDKTFEKTVEVEKHMEEHHHVPKTFECHICKKTFILEWRLKKHAATHTMRPKLCWYYSNRLFCPFEEVGCKFSHDDEKSVVSKCAKITPAPALFQNQPTQHHPFHHGHTGQPQPQHYRAAVHGHGEQPQPQHHEHADQPQHYHHAAVHRLGEQPQPQHHNAAPHSLGKNRPALPTHVR